jgi:hypothetical protein
MQWGTKDMWTVAVPLPPGQEVQYKFVLLSEEGAMLRYCEETTPPGNMNHEVSSSRTCSACQECSAESSALC